MGRIDVAFLQFAQGGQQGVLAFARLVEEFVGFAHHFAQHLAVLLEDGDQRAVVDAGRALHRGAHLLRDVIDDVGAGFGSFHGGGFGSFVLLEEVALDEHVAAQQRGDDESGDAAVDQYEPHRQGDQEAADGVMNHPATTVMTPEMRYTALSRPQALSASDDPIATMKQT